MSAIKLLVSLWVLVIMVQALQPADPAEGTRRTRQQLTVQNKKTELVPPAHNLNNFGSEQIDYRLTRLEVQVAEKSETIRSELRETNRRLQALEWQTTETHTALDGFRNELSRFTEQSHATFSHPIQSDSSKLEERIENLTKGVQLVVVALRGLSSDINAIKTNLTSLTNKTNSLLDANTQLVTKRFFNNGIAEIKHERIYSMTPCRSTEHMEVLDSVPKSCKDAKDGGVSVSGVYKIKPEHSAKPFMVFCDMETRGGGWTYIHNRFEGSQDFYQNWHDYKYGFGNLGGEFWLGLDNIYQLTGSEVNELLIELEDMDFQKSSAYYTAFSIGSEMEGYPLKVLGGYSGDAGDSLIYHAGNRFSTKDMDQDAWPEGSCALAHGGAWWYRGCDTSNLNGKYLNGELPDDYIYQGMYWGEFRGPKYSLLSARMMIRPRDALSPHMSFDNKRKSNDTAIKH